MASSVNNLAISGCLAKDADKRIVGTTSVIRFVLGVHSRPREGEGDNGDYVSWVMCELWGARAQVLAPYLTQGTHVAVTGQLHQVRWRDSSGKDRGKVIVRARDVIFLGAPPTGWVESDVGR